MIGISTVRAWIVDACGDLSTGKFGTLRMTKQRALHVNLRTNTGAELGSSKAPVEVKILDSSGDPLDSTTEKPLADASGLVVRPVPNTDSDSLDHELLFAILAKLNDIHIALLSQGGR